MTARLTKTHVDIVSGTDHQLDGLLCRAEIAGGSVAVVVNREAPLIARALAVTEPHRELLNVIVINELALSASASKDVATAVLTSAEMRRVQRLVDPVDKQRLIVKILADRLKSPTKRPSRRTVMPRSQP